MDIFSEKELLTFAIVMVSAILLGIAMVLARKLKDDRLEGATAELPHVSDPTKCPKCRQYMTAGFAYCPRGVLWRGEEEGRPKPFASAGKLLQNTMSWSLNPKGNRAWRCYQCNLVLIDHSALLAQEKRRQMG